TASLFAAIGTLLALRWRRQTGRGRHIDISLQETAAATLDHVLVRHLDEGILPIRRGSLHWNHEFCCLPCRDGYILVSLSRQWETLVEWLDREGMGEDLTEDRWRDRDFRIDRLDHVIDVIGRWTKTHGTKELFELGQLMQFPWAPLCSLKDVLENEQHRFRDFFAAVDQPLSGGSTGLPRLPWKTQFSRPIHRSGSLEGCRDDERIPCSPLSDGEPAKKADASPSGQAFELSAPVSILSGLRILDFTRVLAGPFATRLLADFGAEVIKIQSRRTMQGDESFRSAYYRTWNRNKRSITLNMDHPEARRIALDLVAKCDVVAENFSPRVMANWNMDYDLLKEIRPDLIMVSLSAMGQTGPWRDYVAFGPTIHALAGLTYLTSPDDKNPAGPGYAYADVVAGLYGGLAVLSALEHRTRTGTGQYIDLSQFEALCTLLGPFLLDEQIHRRQILPAGNRPAHIRAAPYGCYRCAGEDRWCVIAVCEEEHWQALRGVMNHSGWTVEDRFSTFEGRRLHSGELDRRIETWTRMQEAGALARRLREAGIPAGIVQTAEELASDPQLVERGFFLPLEHPVLGRTITDRQPIRFRDEPPPRWKAAPLPDEDNRYVYQELLGMNEAQLSDLMERGVIL
ncbi:MAG: CoA transferase, partial [Deltaproteobacteria bacterium]|nr:CoA transferase [Deltaproteobacteria bacterium]